MVPVTILFFSDGTGLRHPWGQRRGRRWSLYDAHGTEGSDDVNFKILKMSFLSKVYILPVWCPGNLWFWNVQDCHNMMWNAYSPKCRNFHPNDSKCKYHRPSSHYVKTCWNTCTNTWCAETILDVERNLWNDLPSQLMELEVCLMNKACTFVQLC